MLSDKMKEIFKSLRFKLTIAYSLILFFFSCSLVFGINVVLNDHFQNDPRPAMNMMEPLPGQNPFFDFDQAQRQKIRDIRLQDLQTIQQLSELSLIPIFVFSFLLGYFVAGRFLSPLKVLQQKVNDIKESNLGSVVQINSEDEIGLLARSFNDMSGRLKKAFDSQSQFIQDASHELRTPLTIVQTNLEYAAEDKSLSREELQSSIQSALSGMKRVRGLTDKLLEIRDIGLLNKENENISDIVSKQVKSLDSYAKQFNITVVNNTKEKVSREVDAHLLSLAVFNILENAIKYSQDSKDPSVEVEVYEKNDYAYISVKDNGCGIPKDKLDKIFDRFYRVDKSRSSKNGGFGLGLSIAKKIVDDHNGKIFVKSSDKGSKFTIRL